MSERFSINNSEKKLNRQISGAIFGCVGVFFFPVIGTAFVKTELIADPSKLLSNAGFIFSLFLIPLVFFGIYKLDKLVERKIPKREGLSADGENALAQKN